MKPFYSIWVCGRAQARMLAWQLLRTGVVFFPNKSFMPGNGLRNRDHREEVVTKYDRLARSLRDLLDIVEVIAKWVSDPWPRTSTRRPRLGHSGVIRHHCSATIWVRIRIASSEDVPEASCCCLNHLFPRTLTRGGVRFGRFQMTSDARSLQIAQRV